MIFFFWIAEKKLPQTIAVHTMTILTAERLVKLAYNYPALHSTWYLIATAALTVLNQPNEIPKVFHFALRQQLLEYSTDSQLLTDKYLIQLAQDSISLSDSYRDFTAVGVNLPDLRVPYTYYNQLPLKFKYLSSADIHSCQETVASKLREVILKSTALVGLPKTINALMILKNVTPSSIKPKQKPVRECTVTAGAVKSADVVAEDFEGTNFKDDGNTVDTIDGPISLAGINAKRIQLTLARGSNLWNTIYSNKINTRVRNQMYQAYPDLWYFAYHNVYSPLLSFTNVLNARETSLCIVASLIPQDVNPQLKGHLKGALNNGASKEELTDVRLIVFDLCDWSGGVTWKEGKDSVAKL